ncbi:MAG: hypothetical protein U0625_00540 [Phycisphaerales bacterium]
MNDSAPTPDATPARPRGWRAALRHAFAVEPPGPAEPTTAQRAALDPLIAEIRRRGMAMPAGVFLESLRPLNGVGAQTMHFMQPFATAVLDPLRYQALAEYLQRRGSIEWILRELQREEPKVPSTDAPPPGPSTP